MSIWVGAWNTEVGDREGSDGDRLGLREWNLGSGRVPWTGSIPVVLTGLAGVACTWAEDVHSSWVLGCLVGGRTGRDDSGLGLWEPNLESGRIPRADGLPLLLAGNVWTGAEDLILPLIFLTPAWMIACSWLPSLLSDLSCVCVWGGGIQYSFPCQWFPPNHSVLVCTVHRDFWIVKEAANELMECYKNLYHLQSSRRPI